MSDFELDYSSTDMDLTFEPDVEPIDEGRHKRRDAMVSSLYSLLATQRRLKAASEDYKPINKEINQTFRSLVINYGDEFENKDTAFLHIRAYLDTIEFYQVSRLNRTKNHARIAHLLGVKKSE